MGYHTKAHERSYPTWLSRKFPPKRKPKEPHMGHEMLPG